MIKLTNKDADFLAGIFREFLADNEKAWQKLEDTNHNIEELARMHGYENLVNTLPNLASIGELSVKQKREKTIRHELADLGLNEVITYALVPEEYNKMFTTLYKKDAKPIELLHPMSEDHKQLRMGLIPSLVDVAVYNTARKYTDLALFEIGSRYYVDGTETDIDVSKEEMVLAGLMTGKFGGTTWHGGKENVDFYTVKGIIENLEKRLGITLKYQKMTNVDENLHPGRSAEIKFQNEVIGYISALHPAYAHEKGLADTYVFEIVLTKILNQKQSIIKFASLVKKPVVTRDLAFMMEKSVAVGDLTEAIQRTSKDMITKVEVFDLYESAQLGSKKSVAVKVYFESDDNLTDEVIVTVIATGFELQSQMPIEEKVENRSIDAATFFSSAFSGAPTVKGPVMPNITEIQIPDFLRK